MKLTGLPAAPLLLGFVLGPLMEEHFRRAMIISSGDWSTFLASPITVVFAALTVGLLLWGMVGPMVRKRRTMDPAESAA